MTTQRYRQWARRLWWLLPVLAVVFPLLRLLPLNGQFYVDWHNHRWLTGYSGEYLRIHGSTPFIINTPSLAGMPYPVFYGSLFYPVMALFTSWLNPGIVLRLLAVVVTYLQYRLISRALMRAEVPACTARGVACLVIWTIYPLTNLYNRSAITEYVATALLTCVVAAWFLLIHAERAERTARSLQIGLLFALAAGTHPITALYSLPILVLLLLSAYLEHGRAAAFWWPLARSFVVPVALVIVVLAPWLYMLHGLNRYLMIHVSTGGVTYYSDVCDSWVARFYPLPHENRNLDVPLEQISTPFLDAQINLPLLILLIGWLVVLARRNRAAGLAGLRASALGLLAFLVFAWLSLSPTGYRFLPSSAAVIQFAYRLVTYQNLAILFAVLVLADALRRRGDRLLFTGPPIAAAVLAGCLAVSATGVVLKWQRATAIMQVTGSSDLRARGTERRGRLAEPDHFLGSDYGYATPSLYTELSATERETLRDVAIPIGSRDEFGIPQPAQVSLPHDAWIGTNVQAFPWNHLMLDGAEVPGDQLRVDTVRPPGLPGYSARLVIRVPAGSHTIELRSVPDPIWSALRTTSFAVLALWFVYVLYSSVRLAGHSPNARRTRPGMPNQV